MPVADSLLDLFVIRSDGSSTPLSTFGGKVLLVVNVASKCGLTVQYEALEQLYRTYKDRGFEILAFPSNDFAGQEPGSDAEIQQFCSTTHNVSFPVFGKIPVVGPEASALYRRLIAAQPVAQINNPGFRARIDGFLAKSGEGSVTNPPPAILWNFEKFLVGRDGHVLARFAPDVLPDDPRLTAAIESAL